jgi:hypothetical protein
MRADMAGGRPTKYNHTFAEQARKLCLLGATDGDLAKFFGVNEDTINEWKKRHKEFSVSLRKGKDQADSEVADRLYQRARGFEHASEEIKVVEGEIVRVPITKIYPPDTTAGIFWLKNRQKGKWRDRQEIDHTSDGQGFFGKAKLEIEVVEDPKTEDQPDPEDSAPAS